MKLRYRILQTRWPHGGEWKNWGFFYETPNSADRCASAVCHHNLDELHWMVHEIDRCVTQEGLSLENVELAISQYQDQCRVLPEVKAHEQEDGSIATGVNAIEAKVLGIDSISRTHCPEDMSVFSGRANHPLAQAVTSRLGLKLSAVSITPLPDTEVHVQVDEAVRRRHIFVIQPCTAPVNDHLMELLLMIDAFRRASASSITAIIPYFPYARQERMSRGREAISARVVASMLETVGADRVIYVDIHAEATQGFFTVPVDRLEAFPILSEYFRDKPFLEDAVVVAPDVGRTKLAAKYAQKLDVPLAVMQKRRDGFRKVQATHIVGDVEGKIPIVIDDIIASGSIFGEIPELFKKGARREVHLAITHPVLLPSALEWLDEEWISELVVSDTILVPPPKRHPKLEIVSVAPMLAYAIRGIQMGTSISPLWEPEAPRKLGFSEPSGL